MKIPLKRLLFLSAVLFLFDQLLKLYVSKHLTGTVTVLIPGALHILPHKNTNLGWLGGVLQYQSPVWLNVATQLTFAFLSVISYRYWTFVSGKRRFLLDAFLTLSLGAVVSVFTDTVFWGGSWDFICVFVTYILDVKDFYIITAVIFFILAMVSHLPRYFSQSDTERERTKFTRWIKQGCKIQQK